MRDFAFADRPPQLVPSHERSMLPIAVALHVLVLAVLSHVTLAPVRVNSAGSPTGAMVVYLPGPIGAAPAAAPKLAEPKTALETEAAKDRPKEDVSNAGTAAGSAGVVGAAQTAAGPVRLGSGGALTLMRRVQPVYPPIMQTARVTGQVVLDAIIHADGTIGEVTVLQSTNDAFARSAIDAVKQWKYMAVGFEAILTVTVNFTLQ